MTPRARKKPPASTAGPERSQQLADFAELVLSVAREINRQSELDSGLVHLTATEISVVRYINRHPGTMPKEAARGVGLQRSNFSAALRNLKQRGLVEVVADEHDGRSMHLFPTELASRNLGDHRARWARILEPAVPDAADLRCCLEVLARIDDALGEKRRGQERAERAGTASAGHQGGSTPSR